MLPTINRSLLPKFLRPSQLFIISSLISSTLSRYVLSQLHSLLTRSCVIKYNTGTYNIINTGCIWLSDADADCQTGLSDLQLYKLYNPRRVGL